MKQCSYCGTNADDNVTVCSACGASSFSNICPNCGKIYEHGSFCPNCGTNAKARPKTCPRCGSVYFTNACPNCGYNTLSHSQQTPGPSASQGSYASSASQSGYTSSAASTKKTGCGKIVLWILFLPIMAIIAIWKSKRMSVLVKIVLTLLVIGVCAALGESSPSTHAGTTGLDAPLLTEAPVSATEAPAAAAPVAAAPSLSNAVGEVSSRETPAETDTEAPLADAPVALR